jgi:hypothetical protein
VRQRKQTRNATTTLDGQGWLPSVSQALNDLPKKLDAMGREWGGVFLGRRDGVQKGPDTAIK